MDKTLAERLEAAAAAYPEDVFPPPTEADRAEHGHIIQAAAAAMGRHMAPLLLEAARAVREAGAESVDGRVSGYLSRAKAVEVVIDAGIPAWLIRSVGYRVRISAAPTQDQENGS